MYIFYSTLPPLIIDLQVPRIRGRPIHHSAPFRSQGILRDIHVDTTRSRSLRPPRSKASRRNRCGFPIGNKEHETLPA